MKKKKNRKHTAVGYLADIFKPDIQYPAKLISIVSNKNERQNSQKWKPNPPQLRQRLFIKMHEKLPHKNWNALNANISSPLNQ